jgi:hypothetical protein
LVLESRHQIRITFSLFGPLLRGQEVPGGSGGHIGHHIKLAGSRYNAEFYADFSGTFKKLLAQLVLELRHPIRFAFSLFETLLMKVPSDGSKVN